MDRRHLLNSRLVEAAGEGRVYFQPKSTTKLEYPCIVYERSRSDTRFADNKPYSVTNRYSLTVMDKSPTGELRRKVEEMPGAAHSTFFVRDDINHDVFDIFI